MSITVTLGDNAHWGPHVFLEGSGEAEEIRTASARESEGWPLLHFAIADATAEALDPWYRLGFAQMHAYGVRESGGEERPLPGVEIRRGGPDDLETALRIDRLIQEAQASSPSYSSVAFDEGPYRSGWEETLAAADTAYFVAEDGSGALGHATVYPDPAAHALAHAARAGYPHVRTNWRVTNLAASRFWPARGFRLTHIRLVRRLPDL